MSQVIVRDRNKNTDKKPNWEYRFEAAKVDGKRKHISKSGFRTKKEALEAGAKALAEYNRSGIHFEPSEISVADYLDYYFEQYIKINLKYGTQALRDSIIKNHLKPYFGKYKLKNLNASIIQEFVNGLKLDGLSKSTIHGIFVTLSGALDYAVEPLRYTDTNPAKFVKMPKVEGKPHERIILDPDQWKKIINYFQPPSKYYLPLMIGYYTGMRIGEVMGLSWEDIDFNNRTITINKQVVNRNHSFENQESTKGLYLQPLKTAASQRTIKFGNALYNALKDGLVRQKENEIKYGEHFTIYVSVPEKDEKNRTVEKIVPIEKSTVTTSPRVRLVCIDENGRYIPRDKFRYITEIIDRELGIHFNFHALRHTHATRLIESGISPKAVQHRLGHANIQTTLQTYVHNTEQMEETAVDVFEKIARK